MSAKLNKATVVGSLVAAFGLVALGLSLTIKADAQGNVNARIFPFMAAATLVFLGLMEIRQGRIQKIDVNARPLARAGWRSLLLLLLAVAYVWLIGKLGYLLSSGLIAPLAMGLFGIRNPIGLAAGALVCPAVYHLIFFDLMGVFPPFGEWFDLLDVLRGG